MRSILWAIHVASPATEHKAGARLPPAGEDTAMVKQKWIILWAWFIHKKCEEETFLPNLK